MMIDLLIQHDHRPTINDIYAGGSALNTVFDSDTELNNGLEYIASANNNDLNLDFIDDDDWGTLFSTHLGNSTSNIYLVCMSQHHLLLCTLVVVSDENLAIQRQMSIGSGSASNVDIFLRSSQGEDPPVGLHGGSPVGLQRGDPFGIQGGDPIPQGGDANALQGLDPLKGGDPISQGGWNPNALQGVDPNALQAIFELLKGDIGLDAIAPDDADDLASIQRDFERVQKALGVAIPYEIPTEIQGYVAHPFNLDTDDLYPSKHFGILKGRGNGNAIKMVTDLINDITKDFKKLELLGMTFMAENAENAGVFEMQNVAFNSLAVGTTRELYFEIDAVFRNTDLDNGSKYFINAQLDMVTVIVASKKKKIKFPLARLLNLVNATTKQHWTIIVLSKLKGVFSKKEKCQPKNLCIGQLMSYVQRLLRAGESIQDALIRICLEYEQIV